MSSSILKKHAFNLKSIYDNSAKLDVISIGRVEAIDDESDAGRIIVSIKGIDDKKTDEDGYLTWDAEHWSVVTAKKFMRTYSLGDRQLRDFTSHNIYDLRNDFKPEEAKEIQIN